jgi:hypothetical protein
MFIVSVSYKSLGPRGYTTTDPWLAWQWFFSAIKDGDSACVQKVVPAAGTPGEFDVDLLTSRVWWHQGKMHFGGRRGA